MSRYGQSGQMQMNFSISTAVKWIVILTVGVWLFGQIGLENYAGVPFNRFFALYPAKVLYDFAVWQPLTYIFLHTFQVSHIFFNMLMLWFIGTELEQRWGSRFFVIYYLLTGVGAGLIYCLGVWLYFLFHSGAQVLVIPVVGASGAVFGLLLAYGIIFGERVIYAMGVFPMKAKFFVLIMGFVELASLLTSDVNGGDVAYLAHLGGIASGYIVLQGKARYDRWQWSQKAKKKNRNLKLVVDNEKPSPTPKYWN
jgi:membrane associated rhomboid family serine protease